MEFRFSLVPLFTSPIIKVTSNLLPSNFRGDRRAALETTSKMAEIINTIGEYSAKAQGLNKPVTTAQKLRQSEQNLYLLADPDAGKNGVVLGLLKVGRKSLYVFDENGETQTVNALCVLDFYVHESRQRSGLGKTLFETMLQEEQFDPEKLAIDRPSDKLLGFLKKHYGLQKSIPQMNNFVIYEGFFDISPNMNNNQERSNSNSRMEISASPNTALFGPQFGSDEHRRRKQLAAANIPTIQNSPVGRYAAARPACSMAEIIHSTATPTRGESKSERFEANDDQATLNIAVENLEINADNLIEENNVSMNNDQENDNEAEQQQQTNGHTINEEEIINDTEHEQEQHQEQKDQYVVAAAGIECNPNKPQHFPTNKMHTGLKNISYNVGMAVSPTNKMEFEREINRPGQSPGAGQDNIDAQSTVSSAGSGDGYTEQGYFDLKFHHNKLW